MSESQWWEYVEWLIRPDAASTAAQKAGFDKSAFSRWKNGAPPDPSLVVMLARAYEANPLEALVQAGLITDREAGQRYYGEQQDDANERVEAECGDHSALNMAFGDEIRAARARLRLTRAQLSEASGVSAKTIQRIESGERSADLEQMAALCGVLDESIANLVDRVVRRSRR